LVAAFLQHASDMFARIDRQVVSVSAMFRKPFGELFVVDTGRAKIETSPVPLEWSYLIVSTL